MRLSLSILSLLAGASVPALAITLSGKVIDQSGAGKAGVTVSFQGATATTGTDGTWSIPVVNTGISSQLSNGRQVTTGGHLVLDEGHLRVSLSGYDLMGRPRAGNTVAAVPAGTVSGVSARAATAGVDTLLYSWNGKTFLRDTASASRSGIVGIFDTIPNASIIYGWLTDVRDSQVYRTVKIGTQTWMAMNLNYKVDSSWCYDDSASNCTKYGRLYQWAGAMAIDTSYNHKLWQGSDSAQHQGVCPSGWHIPTGTEWEVLIAKVGSDSARIKLSSTSGWSPCSVGNSMNGTDTYGFRVLPAGYHDVSGAFYYLDSLAYFWSSSDYSASSAWIRAFYYGNAGVGHGDVGNKRTGGFSLRCLEN